MELLLKRRMLADWNPRNPRPYLKKWIRTRVGLPWDDTYSILCSTFKRPFLRYQMEKSLRWVIDFHVVYGEDENIYPHEYVGGLPLSKGALYLDKEGVLRVVEKSPKYKEREKVRVTIQYKGIIYTYNNREWVYNRRYRKLVRVSQLVLREGKPVFVKACYLNTREVYHLPLLNTTDKYETEIKTYTAPSYIEKRLYEILIQELERRERDKKDYSPIHKIWFDQLPPDTSTLIERLRSRKG